MKTVPVPLFHLKGLRLTNKILLHFLSIFPNGFSFEKITTQGAFYPHPDGLLKEASSAAELQSCSCASLVCVRKCKAAARAAGENVRDRACSHARIRTGKPPENFANPCEHRKNF